MTQTTQKEKTLLSPRIPRDTEHERYHPELEEELKECLFCLKRNEMMFDICLLYTSPSPRDRG